MVKKFVFGSLVAVWALTLQQCKQPDAPKAEITVVDSVNNVVSGALVKVTSKNYISSSAVEQTQKTDLKGKAYFTFKLEAILQVIVTTQNKQGTDYIQLENGKTVEKTIIVK